MVRYVSIKDISLSVASGITKKKASRGKYNVYGSTGIIGYSNLYDYSGVKILVARVGANAGTINIVDGKYGVSDNTIIIDVSQQYNVKYVYYQLKYLNLHSLIFGSGQPLITGTQLKQLKFRNAELKEQAAIAEALSDVDSLISSLQKLIEKKKAIKQGAMQELLTGKKRLPGFSGEWSKQQLGDICNIINGGTPSTSVAEFWNGKILWCTPTDITSCSTKYIYTTESKITESGLKASSATLLPKGALLLCSRATIGEVRIAGNAICTNQGFKSLVVHQNISNEWLYYMVHILKFNMLEKAIGSTFLEISKKDLAELDIVVPEFTEQKAIAQVLFDMDSEIEQLEKNLAKYQQIKQGMMQELLTGRIRLVDVENNE